jgi:hypothetical protein
MAEQKRHMDVPQGAVFGRTYPTLPSTEPEPTAATAEK